MRSYHKVCIVAVLFALLVLTQGCQSANDPGVIHSTDPLERTVISKKQGSFEQEQATNDVAIQAINQRDPSLCDQTVDSKYCYLTYAVYTWEQSECSKTLDESLCLQQVQKWRNVHLETDYAKNLADCEDTHGVGSLQCDGHYVVMADQTQDESFCDSITSEPFKTNCDKLFSQPLTVESCQSRTDVYGYSRDLCFEKAALRANSLGICDNIEIVDIKNRCTHSLT